MAPSLLRTDVDYNRFPLDTGWAWVICFAGFLTHAVLGSGGQANSILFVELVDQFDTSITTASLLFTCHILAFSISTVVSPLFIMPKITERWTLVLGGCLLSIASTGLALAPNISLFLAFAGLKGCASGIVFVPSIALIRYYFHKRRATASVIAYCGGSVAAIVSPFVIRALRKEFGIFGTFLIQAAIELNVCFAGCLLRPLSAYRPRCKAQEVEEEDSQSGIGRVNGRLVTDIKTEYPSADQVFLEKGEYNVYKHHWNREDSVTPSYKEKLVLSTIKEDTSQNSSDSGVNVEGIAETNGQNNQVSFANVDLSNDATTASFLAPQSEDIASLILSQNDAVNNHTSSPCLSPSSPEVREAEEGWTPIDVTDKAAQEAIFVSLSNAEEFRKTDIYQKLLEQERILLSRQTSSIEERSKPPYGSVFTLASEAGRAIEVLLIEEMAATDGRKDQSRWRQLYNGASLGSWAFRMTLLAALPGTVNQFLIAYLPTITNSQGASLDQAGNLVTIMGAVDLISRLGLGILVDAKFKYLPPSKMLVITQISLGIICQFVRFFNSFPTLIIMVILMGFFVGSRVSLLPLICTEVVGSEKMAQSYSICAMVTALMGAAWSPVLGSIAQATESFIVVMHFIGGGFVVGGFMLLTLPIFVKMDAKCASSTQQVDKSEEVRSLGNGKC